MINLNFYQGSLDFLKKINKTDILIFIISLAVLFSLFKEDINNYLKEEPNFTNQYDIFSRDINNEIELDYILQEIVKKYDADYVNINLFHNGVRSTSGYHFKKMSCIAEGKKPGKLPKIHQLQNWVIAPFKEKLSIIKKEGFIYIDTLRKDPDPYFNHTIPNFGIESIFYVSLYDYRKKDNGQPHFIGFISFAWEKPTNLKEEDLTSMIKERERLIEFIIK